MQEEKKVNQEHHHEHHDHEGCGCGHDRPLNIRKFVDFSLHLCRTIGTS